MLASSACHAAEPSWWKWLDREILDRVQVSGYRQLGYHSHRVSGDDEAFSQSQYFGEGEKRFTDLGNVQLTGRKVLGSIDFDVNIQDSRRVRPQDQRFSVNYRKGPFSVDYGDIRGELLNTNAFTRLSRALRGYGVGYKSGRFAAKALRTEARGEATTLSLQGLNSAGPYYLGAGQIVRGSEQVEVDGVPKKLGQDYIIDYEIGSITFVRRDTLEAQIIPPTSTITVTYESFNFSGSSGRIEGVGLTYDFGKVGKIGLTGLRQVTGSSGGLTTRLEKFQGFGSPSTPYFLQFQPLRTQPIVVRVDGILQTELIDYVFDEGNPSIFYFRRFMPATSDIDVLYTPVPRGTLDGDRESFGWDYEVPLGKRDGDSLKFSQATGKLKSAATPQSGTARGVELRYGWGPSSFRATLRDVPQDFTTVETLGFNRNERSATLAWSSQPGPSMGYGIEHRNSSISSRTTDAETGATTSRSTRFTTSSAYLDWRPKSWTEPLRMRHSRSLTRNSLGETRVDTTEVGSERRFGKLQSRFALRNQDAEGPGTDSDRIKAQLRTLEFGGSYAAGKAWRIQTNTNLSDVRVDGEHSTGRDIGLEVRYVPTNRFSAYAGYVDSDGGETAALSQFSTGYGVGYDGNGFSGGASAGYQSDRKLKRVQAGLDWQPSDRLSTGARVSLSRSSGGFSANAETLTTSFDADLDLGRGHLLSSSLDWSRSKFQDSGAESSSFILSAFLDGAPPGPWSYRLGYSALLSSGTSQYGQDNDTLEGYLSYRLGARNSLNLSYLSSGTRGYLPQDESEWRLTYRHQIWAAMALNVAYALRDVRNLDPTVQSGAYRSSGFDVSLTFDFGV